MASLHKKDKLAEEIREAAASFILREASSASLVTVTRVELSDNLKFAKILFSVFPETKEEAVSDFLSRRRSDASIYIRDNTAIQRLPKISFAIDKGEKNRQRLDELSATTK